jgi:S-methylmethionine-dependent homocysteine/selenocysteine methylase
MRTALTPLTSRTCSSARPPGSNASTRSHQRLDEATELDAGDAVQLAREHADLLQRCPAMAVLGGCCGTDERHVDEMSRACAHHRPVPRHN